MIIKDNIVALVHVSIRSACNRLQREVLAELRRVWPNLTQDQQKDILSDMRWWTAIARHTPTADTKEFMTWASALGEKE